MASKGKNTTDGYYYQLYALMYCDFRVRNNNSIKDYKIGQELSEYDAQDDVILEVTLPNKKKITRCLQVKQAAGNKSIDYEMLKNDEKLKVLKYFKSFLKITIPTRNAAPVVPLEELKEMIIWCSFDLNDTVKSLFETYNPNDNDLLKPQKAPLNYERYRIRDCQKRKELAQDFLDETHPLAELVEKFVTVISNKDIWSSKRAAKSCHRIMAEEVINCRGNNVLFREDFIKGANTLHPDTLLFRRLFEQATKRKIPGLKALGELNGNGLILLKVDDAFDDPWNLNHNSNGVDPLAALVKKFVAVLKQGHRLSSDGVSKIWRRAMAKEVILCEGDNSSFREEFIKGDQTLHRDTLRFRTLFEQAIQKEFPKLTALDELNKKEFFHLKVDVAFEDDSNPWNIKKYVPKEKDLQDFFDRFIYYVGIPNVKAMECFLKEQMHPDFDQLKQLTDICSRSNMLTKEQMIQIFNLTKMQSNSTHEVEAKLDFDAKDLESLRKYFSDIESKFVYVRATQDHECSVSRVFSILNKDGSLMKWQFVLFRDWDTFRDNEKMLLSILGDSALSKIGLKYIVVRCETVSSCTELSDKFEKVNVKIIFVGKQHISVPQNSCWSIHSDDFDVQYLLESTKKIISGREISFFGSPAVKVGAFFSDNVLFEKSNHKLVLSLFRNREILFIGDRIESNPYFVARSIKQKQTNKAVEIDVIDETCSSIIISDQTGMGKTTELIHIAVKLREKYKNYLVVYLNCDDCYSKIVGKETIVDFICEKVLNNCGVLEKNLVKEIMRNKKWMLLLDAYDEVGAEYHSELNSIIRSVVEFGVSKLCITTKPHCEATLTQLLPKSIVCVLEQFSVENQLSYLENVWDLQNATVEQRAIVNQNARAVIEQISRILRDGSLLGIPMQTNMIGEIYKDTIKSTSFTVLEPFEIGAIVEKFIDLKLCTYLKNFDYSKGKISYKKIIETNKLSFQIDHITLAMRMLRQKNDPVTKALLESCVMYRLVQLKPSEGFIHKIYQEFFATKYMLTYHTEEESFKKYMKNNLCTERSSIATKFFDFHIGTIKPETPLKRFEDDETSTEIIDSFAVPSTIRVHKDKHLDFHQYLQNSCTEDEAFTLIRNSVNASVFNVLEVLYDSLPQEYKERMKFRFGANAKKPEKRFINLKIMGENQMLQLLGILRKKHPSSFVAEFLIDFENDEEDFLEVVCRKPFLKVLEWFTELNDDATIGKDQLQALMTYVRRRLMEYLKLVVHHNNSQLLRKVIDWVKMKVPRELTNEIILESSIMSVFVENIAVEGTTKKLIIERRVEMVGIFCDLFQWACNCAVLDVENDLLDIIKDIEHDAIKREFFEKMHFL